MKIVKHQVGGIVYTPYIKGQQAATQAATSSGTTQAEKQGNEIQKAIIKVLEENGLNNDTDYFLKQANKFLSAASSGSLFGKGNEYNLSDLIKLHSLANKIRNNKAEYDEAIERVTDERAGSDVAITNTGGLYVQDEEGKLRVITTKNYYENSDKYTLLTNSDLLVLRKNSPELTYNMTILGDMTNAIGMGTIVEHLRNTIKDFGTMSSDSSDQRYTIKDKGKIEKGFESILGGVAPDGIYKVTNTGKVSDQGYRTEEEMWAAAQYLWTTLDGNMKNVIKAQTVAEGGNPGDPKDVYRLLITALQIHTTHGVTSDRKVDYDASASKAVNGSGSTSKEQQVIDTFGNWVQKNGGSYLTNDLVIEGANINFKTPAYHYNRIENSFNGEQVPVVMTGAETYHNMLGHGVVDTTRNVYFGDLPISNISVTGDGILIDTFKGGRVVYLPVDASGNVDFELYKVMNTIQEEIISDNITDPKHQQQIWEDNGFDYNPVAKIGSPRGYTLMRYWMQPASTSTTANIFDKKSLKSSNFIGKSSDSEKLENLGLKYNNDPLNKNKSKIDIAPGWFGEAYDGMLLIPMNYEQDEAMMAGKIAYTNKENVDNLNAYQQAVQRGNGYGPNRSINGLSSYDLD